MSNRDNEDMIYKVVCFDLPYLILVRDGFIDESLEEWAEALKQGKKDLPYSPYAPQIGKSDFIIGGNLPVYTPNKDDLAQPYVIKVTEELDAEVSFLKRINPIYNLKLCGEVFGDRTGRASFSSVRVGFHMDNFDPAVRLDMDYFIELSILAINKFIQHYKVISGRFYVKTVTPEIILRFYIYNFYKNGSHSIQTRIFTSGPLFGLGGTVKDSEDDRLRKALMNQETPPIVEILRLEALDKLDLREWRLAVIEANILFETWLNSFLRKIYQHKGLTVKEIEDKFHRKDKYKTPLSVHAMAKELIKDATGFDFGSTREFEEWCKKAKDLRNSIVHGKKHTVTKNEAFECYKSIIRAIETITENTKQPWI